MHRICVFTGSNLGVRPEYQQAARAWSHAGWGWSTEGPV